MPTPEDKYYCRICEGYHKRTSEIGKRHKTKNRKKSGAQRRKRVKVIKRRLSGYSS